MPPKFTPKKVAEFKSCVVGRSVNKDINDTIHQLPEDLKKLWSARRYKEFLISALQKLEGKDCNKEVKWKNEEAEELSYKLLCILPECAPSYDEEVHLQIQEFYCKYTYLDEEEYRYSMYDYVMRINCSLRSKLVPKDWIEQVFPDYDEFFANVKAYEKDYLKKVRENLKYFSAESPLEVESEFASYCRGTTATQGSSCVLLNIALWFVRKSNLYKLDSVFTKCPGVYLLYYVGERDLYEKSPISSSDSYPVYIGMSTVDISQRLTSHKKKIEDAKDLKVTDFGVRVILVDIKHYAPCIEGMLIEHVNPVWNRETVGFNFGGGDKANNMWNKYHVQQDEDTITQATNTLKLTSLHSSSSESDRD